MQSIFIRTLLALLIVLISISKVYADRDFQERFATNLTGDYLVLGNTNITCTASCGTNQTNNPPAVMGFNNIDPTGNFNSTSADLNLPTGATVEWAALYWTGVDDVRAGLTGPPNPALRNQVKFRTPGSATYTTITADQFDTNAFSNWDNYMAVAEVTTLVQSAGSGSYFVADIQASTGSAFTGPNASWVLVVVYSAPGETFRRINVWDGWKFFGFGAFENFTITGLLTPANGDVQAKVAQWAMDGEVNQTGDTSTLNNIALSNGANPANNFANGTITDEFGANVSSRDPDITPYNWGMDLDVYSALNYLPNNSTTADVSLGSSSEGIWSGLYILSTELVVPSIIKSFTPDEINFTESSTVSITLTNPSEGIALTGVTLTDTLPADMIIDDPNNLTNTCSGTVTATPGTDQLLLTNGVIPVDSTCTITFSVTTTTEGVFDNVIPKESLTNDQGLEAQEDATATLTVLPIADLSVTKTDTDPTVDTFTPGAAFSYTIVVSNAGPSAADDSVFQDSLPSWAVNVNWTCGDETGGALCPNANGAGNINETIATFPANSSLTYTVTGTYSADMSDYP